MKNIKQYQKEQLKRYESLLKACALKRKLGIKVPEKEEWFRDMYNRYRYLIANNKPF